MISFFLKSRKLLPLFLTVMIWSASEKSAQGYEFVEYGGLTFSAPTLSTSPSSGTEAHGGFGLGIGATFGGYFRPDLSFEVGVFYSNVFYTVTSPDGPRTGVAYRDLQFPLFVRYHFKNMNLLSPNEEISFAAGPYFGRNVSQVVLSQGDSFQDVPISALSLSPSDLGVGGSIRYCYRINPMIRLAADLRGLLALRNRSLSGDSYFPRFLELWIGVAWTF